MSKLEVVELFAGVGGFRIGLEATENLKLFGVINGSLQLNPACINGL